MDASIGLCAQHGGLRFSLCPSPTHALFQSLSLFLPVSTLKKIIIKKKKERKKKLEKRVVNKPRARVFFWNGIEPSRYRIDGVREENKYQGGCHPVGRLGLPSPLPVLAS